MVFLAIGWAAGWPQTELKARGSILPISSLTKTEKTVREAFPKRAGIDT
jgi:hypothetical protein